MATRHVIIGGGPVATNALETIRQFEKSPSEITLLCDEPAHSRMALPYWLSGQVPREHTHTADDAYYQKFNVDARIGVRVDKVDAKNQTLSLSDGSTLEFDNLLIATGASPVSLSIPGADLPGVQSLWTLADTGRLLDEADGVKRPRVLMIGAGFIGFIMLNAMYKRGWDLAVVEREPHVLPRMLDAEAATLVESWLASKQVDVRCGATVGSIAAADNGAKVVELSDGNRLEADVVIVAVGIRPNLDLVAESGIETDEGILVDDALQTNSPNIYAGGDVAQGPVLFSSEPAIHAIQPTAVDHGRIAGANMAGHEVHYPGSLSMNILDVCGLQNASFGNWIDPNAEAITVSHPGGHVYRKLLFTGEEITGALFVGRANDMGMLTDVGMVKGIMQTRTQLGPWKAFLAENPTDIRRPYIATNVAQKLAGTTLLGRPAKNRQFQFRDAKPQPAVGSHHAVYVGTKTD
jgi:NAD(P)H-nitrite reductase large subunit